MAIFGRGRRSLRLASTDPLPGISSPAELKQAAGAWLADRLADEGFVWVKSGEVTRKVGARREFVHWTASKYNTAASGSSFDMFAVVFDSGLERWRKQHPERTVSVTKFVANQADKHHDLRLRGAETREPALAQALEWYRSVPLPWFDLMRDPERMVREVDGRVRPDPLIEWLVWTGREDLVPALVDRVWATWLTRASSTDELHVRLERGVQLAQDGEPLGPHDRSDGAVVLGWSLTRNHLQLPR